LIDRDTTQERTDLLHRLGTSLTRLLPFVNALGTCVGSLAIVRQYSHALPFAMRRDMMRYDNYQCVLWSVGA
jgi:hypothetical protein